MYDEKIRALRMERQHLLTPANETEYDALYRKPLKNATMTQTFYHGKRRSSPPCRLQISAHYRKDLWGRSRKIRRPRS